MAISLIQMDNQKRVLALNKIGFEINDDGYVYNSATKKEVMCIYSKERVHINTAALLPGSVKIVNATPTTMAEYFLETDL